MQPPYGYDPYAAERALGAWASTKSFVLNATPDGNWYLAWYPMSFLPRFTRLGRELRGSLDDAGIYIVETFDPDPFKQAAGEDRMVAFFLTSPKLTLRAAVRAKSGGGVMTELSSGLGSLFRGESPGSLLGDPTLEARFDVMAPSRDEGNAALPMPLRQLLVSSGFRGILEVRAGGLAISLFDLRFFDAPSLDRALPYVEQLYRAACAR